MLERSITWLDEGSVNGKARLINQTKLPWEYTHVVVETHERMARSIKTMEIRGAPAIGAAAGMGMALAAIQSKATNKAELIDFLEGAKKRLDATRPTAVNLTWATTRMLEKARALELPVKDTIKALIDEAKSIADEDVEINKAIGRHGSPLLDDGETVLTHCNAGAIATVGYGTALGVIRAAVASGKSIKVISDETRPRLQGARLTCWELMEDEIPVVQITDNQAALLMKMGEVQKVIVGADRIVSDAVFNKIGTYGVAIMARYHEIPFYVAAPKSTLDLEKKMKDVEIEQRDQWEVKTIFNKVKISPDGVEAYNYAFDPTPMDLVTAIITEDGVFPPEDLVKHYKIK
ncbi:MAG: S-methyl-5-thioribose-1-phosphate isomerase [Candidatus Hodarchaeota archaeon]